MRPMSARPLIFVLPLLLLIFMLLTLAPKPAHAALGWVGNMFPLGNADHSITAGNNFNVYVQVWKGGVTDSPGQGADITCSLLWSEVNSFGGTWLGSTTTPMSYNVDIGNDDEYMATISPPSGLYEFTAECTDTTDNQTLAQQAGYGRLTVTAAPSPVTLTDAQALWLDRTTIGWNGTAASSYRLLYDEDGGLVPATAEATACTFPLPATCYVNLTPNGTISGYIKNPNATGLLRLDNTLTAAQAKALLKGQTAVASYDGGGSLVDISGVQIQSVLDDLYVDNGTAVSATLGVTYTLGIPTLNVWAPTAQEVVLYKFEDASTTISTTHTLTEDANSGVWSVTGDATWDRDYYLLGVTVYTPVSNTVQLNQVTDPYAITLSADGASLDDPRSQFVNLDDSDLKPTGWDSLTKPTLNNFEDITIYEMHIRDFSINDSTVAQADRGTYMAFTYDGAGPDPNTTLSDGMNHLLALQEAGLTHVHLLPTFDIASVQEDIVPRDVWPNPTGYAADSDQQQAAVAASRAIDGFNWGYDPYHYGAVEGSYSTNPNDGTQRILEFRRMVSALNQNDLRVVMDVVYNHTAASGQFDRSVLDQVVPGYYYRYDTNGVLQQSSCCPDTATEYDMMEKLMIDTLERFAIDYKVDGFRFDLMNLHTRRNMENVQTALNAIDPDIYLYGEGWTFGSAMEKGLTDCTNGWCFAHKYNMSGLGIGLFNDIIRDAAHGGYSQDSLQIRKQGFINGLSYDWNGHLYPNRFQSDLHISMDILRSGLRASGTDWNGQGGPFTADPQESMPYISKHDNETLFDQNVFKMPSTVTMDERVRAQNLGLSIIGLSQGVPFFHMASDILRSKSLDRNTYDSGDWFNRVYWDRSHNNFGQGLPPAWDNASRWGIMGPHLADASLVPTTADMDANAAHFREILRIRQSSPLFRLTTEAEVNNQVTFYNGANTQDALLVMALNDSAANLDPNYETIVVFFNANTIAQDFTIAGANGFVLHPIHTDSTDEDPVLTGGASFDDGTDTFTIPARTTAVFVSPNAITPPLPASTIDFVGRMWPRGGVVTAVDEGAFAPAGFDVFVQVYEAGVTDAVGQGAGISCTLHWGEYGSAWTDIPMTYNGDILNNDEYMATIPQATLDVLAPGSYGFTAYCEKPGEDRAWKQDLYDIDGNPADDDQGDGLITIIPAGDVAVAPAGGTFVHLFEWPWADIERECTYLSEMGYTAVQVSPPNEHLVATATQGGQPNSQFPWWVRYQPVTHDATLLESRSGSMAEFQSMVTVCGNLGVDIYVDAVFNHMADIEVGTPATGTAGTTYDNGVPDPSARYYGAQYGANSFHTDCNILSYADRFQVQNCKLSGLPDLDTGNTAVQNEIRTYLQALIDMGVDGFRIDGAKHMAAYDIAAILDGLTGDPYIFQEVIDADPTERVRDWEYAPHGDVTEFNYAIDAMSKFNTGTIADLETLPTYNNMMPSRFAVVFTDNHDNQRGHGPGGGNIVDHRDGANYDLANVFMLAYPYGYPKVMSSYYWSNNPADDSRDSYGPPSTNDGGTTWGAGLGADTRPVYGAGQVAGDDPANCSDTYVDGTWVCEHRRMGIANMVQFRAVTAGEAVTNWWDDGAEHLAFGRGAMGFVAINNGGSNTSATTYQTSMAAGVYCDVISGQRTADGSACTGGTVTVNGSGQIENYILNSKSAFAIHAQSRIGTPQLTASQDFDLAISGTDAVTATLLTHDGLPVTNTTVNFAVLSGGGTVPATAVTNANGEAVINYTAPNTVTVGIIASTYTSAATDALEGLTAVYVGYRADVSQLQVSRLATGSDTAVLGPLQVTKNGTGTPLLTLAIFNGNPQTIQPEGGESSAYVDIHLPDTTNVTSLDVVLDCIGTCGTAVWWGDPVTGNWVQVSNANLVINSNEVSFTIDGSSTPSLSDLTGTPFVVSTNQPLAVTLQSINSNPSPAAMPLLLAAGLLLLLLALTGWAIRRPA